MANDQARLVHTSNEFCFDLYHRLSHGEGNVFLSPYSISTALAMTYAGARGNTQRQMGEVLGFDPELNEPHTELARIRAHIEGLSQEKDVVLATANAIWSQSGQEFLEEFIDTLTRHYAASPEYVDFEAHTDEARRVINTWVSQQTKGKITGLMKPGMLDSLTRLLLVNAIYFNGKWAHRFDKTLTRNAPFELRSAASTSVPMMNQTGMFRYLETKDLQVLQLPYSGETLSMVVLLTKDAGTLEVLEETLTAAKLDQWVRELRLTSVEVTLPRFRVSSQFDLADTLAAMGMPDAFKPGADFSGMTQSANLQIAAVIHKAFVDVGESGTEASAATAVVKKTRSAPRRPAIFRADHPFLFLIRDERTGIILFIGRLAEPSSSF